MALPRSCLLTITEHSVVYVADVPGARDGFFRITEHNFATDSYIFESFWHHAHPHKVSLRSSAGNKHPKSDKGGSAKSLVGRGVFGLIYQAGHVSRDWFYSFSHYGIVPMPNRKFDLFYFFNSILGDHYSLLAKNETPFWPEEVLAFAIRALGGLTRSNSDFTFLSRFTDASHMWFCGLRGEVAETDERLAQIPTATELLSCDFFLPLRVADGAPERSPLLAVDARQILDVFTLQGPPLNLSALGNGGFRE